MVAGGGFEPPSNITGDITAFDVSDITGDISLPPTAISQTGSTTIQVARTATSLINIDPSLLEEFRGYVFNRYTYWHARNIVRYLKLGLEALQNPLILKNTTWRKAKYALEALRAFEDFAKLKGVMLSIDYDTLKKHMARKSIVEFDIFEYESKGDDIVKQAVEMLTSPRGDKRPGKVLRLAALTAFFTGLRGSEIRYMFSKWKELRKVEHSNVVVVHLGYDRVKKKAWITMIPKELADVLDSTLPLELGKKLDQHLRECGISLKLLRKAHTALLLNSGLDSAEVDLLQGRLSKVIVAHYIKSVRSIAEKYRKAVEPYLYLIQAYTQYIEGAANQE